VTDPSPLLRPGQRLGPYEVLEVVGAGAQGLVLRARDGRSGRLVALKVLADPDPRARDRLVREARILIGTRHPHLVRVVDVGEAAGLAYLALEWVEGETLAARVRRGGPLPAGEVRAVLAAVAGALAHCHARGVVHRDVKPANVLVERPTERVVLVDLGLAKLLPEAGRHTRLTETGEVIGTPGLLAPEQAGATPVDARTDVYGLGALGYFLLTGVAPFRGATLLNVLNLVLTAEPPDPRDEAAATPPDLAALCRAAMAKDPARRPESAEAFLARLDRGGTRAAGPARSRGPVVAAVAVLAACLAVAGAVVAGGLDAGRPEGRSPSPTAGSPPDRTPAPAGEASPDAAAEGSPGAPPAAAPPWAAALAERPGLLRLEAAWGAGPDAEADAGPVHALAWIPGLVVAAGDDLVVRDPVTGEVLHREPAPDLRLAATPVGLAPADAPLARRIVGVDGAGRVLVWEAGGAAAPREVPLEAVPAAPVAAVAVDPVGATALVVAADAAAAGPLAVGLDGTGAFRHPAAGAAVADASYVPRDAGDYALLLADGAIRQVSGPGDTDTLQLGQGPGRRAVVAGRALVLGYARGQVVSVGLARGGGVSIGDLTAYQLPGVVEGLAASSDGRRAAACGGHVVALLDVPPGGGRPAERDRLDLPRATGLRPTAVAFGPDDGALLVGAEGGVVLRFRIDGG